MRSARAPQLDETQARQRARARERESEAQVSESRAELSPKARNQASDADKGSWLKDSKVMTKLAPTPGEMMLTLLIGGRLRLRRGSSYEECLQKRSCWGWANCVAQRQGTAPRLAVAAPHPGFLHTTRNMHKMDFNVRASE